MNEPAWRSAAKIIGVAIAKLWLQEQDRQLNLDPETKVSNSFAPPLTVAKTMNNVSTKTKTGRSQ
jgi:hypothetical protein